MHVVVISGSRNLKGQTAKAIDAFLKGVSYPTHKCGGLRWAGPELTSLSHRSQGRRGYVTGEYIGTSGCFSSPEPCG